jgi:hypothetical protein
MTAICAIILSKRAAGLVSSERLSQWSSAVSEGARLRVGYPAWLRFFLQKGVIAITLGRTVYVSEKAVGKSDRELMALVRHEMAHVHQVAQLGLFRFLYRYVREYISLRRSGLKSFQAYEEISFEREARAAEAAPESTGVVESPRR